jgi:hypothetical protein
MRGLNWKITLGIGLLILSAVVYIVHYFIFRDPHHIFIYMIGDIAFVFVEVLLVTLIIHSLLSIRDRRNRLDKLNMVIGAFFSEMGTTLLAHLSDYDPNLDKVRNDLIITDKWSDEEFVRVSSRLRNYEYNVRVRKINLIELRTFLQSKRDFLLRLLENPVLLEHESFSELLRTVFHLTDELIHRERLQPLPELDYEHLAGDMKRVYTLLVHQWLDYMKHLKKVYPYLFSLAMRTNPFDQEASAIVS